MLGVVLSIVSTIQHKNVNCLVNIPNVLMCLPRTEGRIAGIFPVANFFAHMLPQYGFCR